MAMQWCVINNYPEYTEYNSTGADSEVPIFTLKQSYRTVNQLDAELLLTGALYKAKRCK